MNGQLTWFEVITIFLSLLGFVTTAFGIVIWFNIRQNVLGLEKLKEDLALFKTHVATHHPDKDMLASIFDRIDQIRTDISSMANMFRDRLDQKADK
jgi:hypothetical protein